MMNNIACTYWVNFIIKQTLNWIKRDVFHSNLNLLQSQNNHIGIFHICFSTLYGTHNTKCDGIQSARDLLQ